MALTPAVICGLLRAGPRHGYDIKSAYDELFGGLKALPPGQVYTTLARLERDGLVEQMAVEPGQGPDRKTYRLTDVGSKELAVWIDQSDVGEAEYSLRLHARVALASRLAGTGIGASTSTEDHIVDPVSLMRQQRQTHQERMRAITARRRNRPDGDPGAALDDLELFHLEADLRWIEHRLDEHSVDKCTGKVRP